MAHHRTWGSLMAAQQKRFARAITSVEDAAQRMASALEEDAAELLSGSVTSKQLRQMGHPFGRGLSAAVNYVKAGNVGQRGNRNKQLGRRAIPLRPVNRQTGRLFDSIRLRRGKSKLTHDLDIGSGVRYARYILHPAGTRLMVGRGVMGWRDVNRGFPMGELERRHRTRNRLLRDALKRAHRTP